MTILLLFLDAVNFPISPYLLTGNNTVKHPMEIFGIDNNRVQHMPC